MPPAISFLTLQTRPDASDLVPNPSIFIRPTENSLDGIIMTIHALS